jgi:hypothetical protein
LTHAGRDMDIPRISQSHPKPLGGFSPPLSSETVEPKQLDSCRPSRKGRGSFRSQGYTINLENGKHKWKVNSDEARNDTIITLGRSDHSNASCRRPRRRIIPRIFNSHCYPSVSSLVLPRLPAIGNSGAKPDPYSRQAETSGCRLNILSALGTDKVQKR